jgi:hypothetical protein
VSERLGDALIADGKLDGRTIAPRRRAMLAAQAALDPELKHSLAAWGLVFTVDELDPYLQLRLAVSERAGSPAEVPRVLLARTALRVLEPSRPQRANPKAELEPVLAELLTSALRDGSGRDKGVDDVLSALREANAVDPAERWSTFVEGNQELLHSDLLLISQPVVITQLREGDNEFAARVEVRFEVLDPGGQGLNIIAPRALPAAWPTYNSFFCAMEETDRGDQLAPGRLQVPTTAGARSWRRVYLEKVGACPGGWFPDTYLLFAWSRSESQLIVYYALAERRPGDRTVLKIDEGYIQIDQLPGRYEVTALKTLLFDDKRCPSGGQLLAGYAFELGWLDQAINWFSIDAADAGASPLESASGAVVPEGKDPEGLDAPIQEMINGCEVDVRHVLSDVDAQCRSSMVKLRAGTYGLDAYVRDCALVTDRTIRYGARTVDKQIKLVKALLRKEKGTS